MGERPKVARGGTVRRPTASVSRVSCEACTCVRGLGGSGSVRGTGSMAVGGDSMVRSGSIARSVGMAAMVVARPGWRQHGW
eukprot:5619381-Prymnesium_polylepis.1